jgi:PAS domain S-box-containing protein
MVLELLQRPEMAGVPIIMLTAKADDALRLRLLQAGVQDYLNKPFKVEELLARVGGLLAERQRAGDALRASEDRFEATFEQAAVGIALVATDGHWLRVNRKLCEIVGYTPDELMTKTFQDITHPDDLEADLGQVRRMLAREIDSYAMEKRCLHKNGGIVWINLTVTLIWRADGTPDYFISVIEDITARKQAEAALQVTEHRYREVVENANSAILHWSSDGTITFFNEYAQRLFGWSADEIVGRHVSILVPDQSTDGIDLSNLVQDITTHPERYLSNVNENVCRDGRRLWMNWTNRALRDDLGRVTGLLAVGNDISALKQAEEELKRRNEELERFDRASVGRELEMIRLKRQVNELSVELGRAAPHDLAFVDGPAP